MPSVYSVDVDVNDMNSAHALMLGLVGSDKRVLELGASGGHMTKIMRERGCAVTAIESDPNVLDELKEFAETVISGDLNDPHTLDQVSGQFDVVVLGDVLEHLLDPQRVLEHAVSKLSTDGCVVVSLPHVAHIDMRLGLLQGRFDYTDCGILDRTHLKFFTLQTIIDMVDRADLAVVSMHRVMVAPFQSEIQVDRNSVSQDLLDSILADPESQTYQFVFAAVRKSAGEAGEFLDLPEPRKDAAAWDRAVTVTVGARGKRWTLKWTPPTLPPFVRRVFGRR